MKIEVPDNIPCTNCQKNATVYEEILAYPTVTLAAVSCCSCDCRFSIRIVDDAIYCDNDYGNTWQLFGGKKWERLWTAQELSKKIARMAPGTTLVAPGVDPRLLAEADAEEKLADAATEDDINVDDPKWKEPVSEDEEWKHDCTEYLREKRGDNEVKQ